MSESKRLINNWTLVDAIEVSTVGRDREQPAGREDVERITNAEAASGAFAVVSHSVYVHRPGIGATCVADCWDHDAAQQLGLALGHYLRVPVNDWSVEADVEVAQ